MAKQEIVILPLQALSDEAIDFPEERCSNEEELIKRTGDADVILVDPWDKVTARYLDACPSVKYVCICGTSTANVDLEELKKRNMGKSVGVIGLGALGKAIAHLALAYKMNASYFSLHRKQEWEDQGLRYADLPTVLKENDNYQAYKDVPRVMFADVVAGYTHEALERLYAKVLENIAAY